MKRSGKVLSVVIILFAGFAAWALYADGAAEEKATAFCGTVSPGDPVEGIAERALGAGADRRMTRWVKGGQLDWLPVTFVGVPPFSRFTCSIQASGGAVISREVVHID